CGPRVEDYVAGDNRVRGIDAWGDALDLLKLGFRPPGSEGGAGQPPHHPRHLLKLHVYGYLHRMRLSRRLEREAGRNLELIWLLNRLKPGYPTLSQFRHDTRGRRPSCAA